MQFHILVNKDTQFKLPVGLCTFDDWCQTHLIDQSCSYVIRAAFQHPYLIAQLETCVESCTLDPFSILSITYTPHISNIQNWKQLLLRMLHLTLWNEHKINDSYILNDSIHTLNVFSMHSQNMLTWELTYVSLTFLLASKLTLMLSVDAHAQQFAQWVCQQCKSAPWNFVVVFIEITMARIAVGFLLLWLSVYGCMRGLGTFFVV